MGGVLEFMRSLELCSDKQGEFLLQHAWSPELQREHQLDPKKRYIRIRTECLDDSAFLISPDGYLEPSDAVQEQWRRATEHCRRPNRDSSGLPIRHKISVGHDGIMCLTRMRWVSYNPMTKQWEKSEH